MKWADFINWFQLFRSFLLIIRRPSDWHGLTMLQGRQKKRAQPLTRTEHRECQITRRWPNTEYRNTNKRQTKMKTNTNNNINVRLCWSDAPRYYYFSRHRTLKSARTRKICLNHLIWWCVVSLKRVWLPRQVRLGVTRRTSRNQLNSILFFFVNTPHFSQIDERARRQEKLWIEKSKMKRERVLTHIHARARVFERK